MPNFSVINLEGRDIRSDSITSCYPYTLIMYFHTDCEYCREEIKSMVQNQEKMRNIGILLISSEPIDSLRAFALQEGLLHVKQFVVARDTSATLPIGLNLYSIPTSILYHNRTEIARYKGQILAPAIIKDFHRHGSS